MTHVAHVALGPVQGFIAEARRTRDWWAGSFLLAWLAGTAMRAVEGRLGDGGPRYGRVTYPALDDAADGRPDPMWRAFDDRGAACPVGTLPNRFRVELDLPDAFARDDPCRRAVRRAWFRLAAAVWRHFLRDVAWSASGVTWQRERTRKVWKRQVGGYFELAWVVGDSAGEAEDGDWLDRRKSWRSHPRADEPGDHCRMMGDLQELSGLIRAQQRREQDLFWGAVRQAVWDRIYPDRAGEPPERAAYDLLELAETERLCAVALVKRLFPLLPEATLRRIIGWNPHGLAHWRGEPSGDRPGGVRHWPSTATIAAAPWLRWAWKEGEDRCRQFADEAVRRFPVEQQPEPSRVRSLRAMGEFGALDGTLFYEDALEAEIARAEAALEEARRKRDRVLEARHAARIDRRKRVLGELDGLRKAVEPAGRSFRERKFRAAAPYFALLVMDGDRTGRLIGRYGGGNVSQALARFTRDVVGDSSRPGIVERHDGVLIYAGGDDVQAMLPLDQALPATLALREAYLAAFGPAHPATISAGLVFADHGEPLGAVIRKARGLLEDDAKEGNCRDSLALAVLRPSGSTLKIVTAFDPPPGEKVGAIRAIRALAERFGNDPDDTATRFLYRVRERYSGTLEDRPDREVRFAGEERRDILRAEWAKGRGASDGVAGVAERVAELEAACLVADADRRPRFTLDGALIARFLADRGVTVAPPPEPSPP